MPSTPVNCFPPVKCILITANGNRIAVSLPTLSGDCSGVTIIISNHFCDFWNAQHAQHSHFSRDSTSRTRDTTKLPITKQIEASPQQHRKTQALLFNYKKLMILQMRNSQKDILRIWKAVIVLVWNSQTMLFPLEKNNDSVNTEFIEATFLYEK